MAHTKYGYHKQVRCTRFFFFNATSCEVNIVKNKSSEASERIQLQVNV